MLSPKGEKRLFFAVGVPCLVIFSIIAWSGFLTEMVIVLAVAGMVYFAMLHGKRERRFLRATKVSVILAIVGVVPIMLMVQNPAYWGEQLYYKLDRAAIITPDDPAVAELYTHFESWRKTSDFSADPYNKNWYWANFTNLNDPESFQWAHRNVSIIDQDAPTLLDLAILIDFYVRNNTITWRADDRVYGFTDYVATPAQILAQRDYTNESNRAYDDCDGIAVVTVSLMQRYGINAFIGTGRRHWFTVVEIPGEPKLAIFNFWEGIHLYAYFNQTTRYIGQPVDMTVVDLLFDYEQGETLGYLQYFVENPAFTWALCFGIVALAFLVLRTRPRPEKAGDLTEEQRDGKVKRWLKRIQPFQRKYVGAWVFTLVQSVLLTGGFYLVNFIATNFPPYTYLSAFILIGVLVRAIDSARLYSWFKKIPKDRKD